MYMYTCIGQKCYYILLQSMGNSTTPTVNHTSPKIYFLDRTLPMVTAIALAFAVSFQSQGAPPASSSVSVHQATPSLSSTTSLTPHIQPLVQVSVTHTNSHGNSNSLIMIFPSPHREHLLHFLPYRCTKQHSVHLQRYHLLGIRNHYKRPGIYSMNGRALM